MTVSVREVTPEGDEYIRVGKLYLVDLAGSENITRWAHPRRGGGVQVAHAHGMGTISRELSGSLAWPRG